MKHYHALDVIALILLLVGGINLGLVGLFDFDVLGAIFGMVISRIIFVLVGIAAIYRAVIWVQAKSRR